MQGSVYGAMHHDWWTVTMWVVAMQVGREAGAGTNASDIWSRHRNLTYDDDQDQVLIHNTTEYITSNNSILTITVRLDTTSDTRAIYKQSFFNINSQK